VTDEPRIVSWSEISSARQCLLKHRLEYRERWSADSIRSSARGVGTAWNKVMEAHYRLLQAIQQEIRDGKHEGVEAPGRRGRWVYPDETAGRLRDAVRATGEFTDDDTGYLIDWMYIGHLGHYGLDPGWTILAVEFSPVGPLPRPGGGESEYTLKTKIDLVIFDLWSERTWIIDHKSGKYSPESKELRFDDQFGLYTWILRHLGRPVIGSMVSWATTSRTKTEKELKDRFARRPLDRSDDELDQIALDAYRTVESAYSHGDDEGDPPVSPDSEMCKRRCDFSNAHLHARRQPVAKAPAALRAYLVDTGYSINRTRH